MHSPEWRTVFPTRTMQAAHVERRPANGPPSLCRTRAGLRQRGRCPTPGPSPMGEGKTAGLVKLLFLGGAGERRRGREAAADHLRHVVEVAGAYLALMLGGGVALWLERELTLLQLGIGRHAAVAIP